MNDDKLQRVTAVIPRETFIQFRALLSEGETTSSIVRDLVEKWIKWRLKQKAQASEPMPSETDGAKARPMG